MCLRHFVKTGAESIKQRCCSLFNQIEMNKLLFCFFSDVGPYVLCSSKTARGIL